MPINVVSLISSMSDTLLDDPRVLFFGGLMVFFIIPMLIHLWDVHSTYPVDDCVFDDRERDAADRIWGD